MEESQLEFETSTFTLRVNESLQKNNYINPVSAKLTYLNVHPVDMVSRYRDPHMV